MTDDYKTIDEIKLLIQERKGFEIADLKQKLINRKIIANITVWNNVVIDGITEYEICINNSIPFRVLRAVFPSLLHVYSWICSTQLKRDDLYNERRKFLIGYQALAETAIEDGSNSLALIDDQSSHGDIESSLASLYHISAASVMHYRKRASNIVRINKSNNELALYILSDRLQVSYFGLENIAEKSIDEMKCIVEIIKKESSAEQIRYIDICKELRWFVKIEKPKRDREFRCVPEIRKMPEYDPDAQLLSLSLTIPFWINMIKRVLDSEINKASVKAKKNLAGELDDLLDASIDLRNKLEVYNYEK